MAETIGSSEVLTSTISDAPLSDVAGRGDGAGEYGYTAPFSRRGAIPELPVGGVDLRARLEEEVRIHPLRSAFIAIAVGFALGRVVR